MIGELHPAENRALRELYATTHQLAEHWERLAAWLADADPETADALASGARLAVRVHAELADHRGDSRLAEFHRGARSRIDRATNRVRKAAIALGGRPDGAIRPVDPSPAGRAGQRAASTAGAVGEWIDRRGRG